MAEHNATVLMASCSRAEEDLQFGVLRQLLQDLRPPEGSLETAAQVDEHILSVMLALPNTAARQTTMLIHDHALRLLRTVVGQRPLVLVVDDIRHIDSASAECLLFIIRRLRSAPLLLVVSDLVTSADIAPLRSELQLQPDFRTIRFGRLSQRQVDAMVAALAPGEDATLISASCYAMTGGNPLLVRALLDDHTSGAIRAEDLAGRSPRIGPSFSRAVLRCLQRAQEPALSLACGMAVLGTDWTHDRLTRLLNLAPSTVEKAVAGLVQAGLLRKNMFRHPAIQTAVLREMSPQYRAELHLDAAGLLFREGAPPRRLAAHLVTAQSTAPAWAVPTLQHAARLIAADGDPALALRCLELAASDDRYQGSTKAAQLELLWRTDPAEADRHGPGLLELLARGHLSVGDAFTLIRHLLWHGRLAEAVGALADVCRCPDFAESAPMVRTFKIWLAHVYPAMARLVPAMPSDAEGNGRQEFLSSVDSRVLAVSALSDVLTNQPGEQTVSEARRILRGGAWDELTFMSAQSAQLTLVYTDHLGDAAHSCDHLLAEATRTRVPTWHALLTGIRAEIHRRLGDLAAAAACAQAALDELPDKSWGVPIGQPLSCLLLTRVAMGVPSECAHLIERPVPAAIRQSAHGLVYRYACGSYRMVTDHVEAAIHEFAVCGELAQEWGLDVPTVVPWRGGMADALDRLGRRDEARKLLSEQLALAGESQPRARGITLRQLARGENADEARHLLTEAAGLLQNVGDRFELARALRDLSEVHSRLGQSRWARSSAQRALRLARECGISEPLDAPLTGDLRQEVTQPHAERLTRAEQRVAVLAARGHTNREIAEKLFITPSTVEQHLTKIFRKLRVKQRDELPLELSTENGGERQWTRLTTSSKSSVSAPRARGSVAARQRMS